MTINQKLTQVKYKSPQEALRPKLKKEQVEEPIEESRLNVTFETQKQEDYIKAEARKFLASQSLYYYCKLMDPTYYTETRTYLKTYCDTLQALNERRIYSTNIYDCKYHEDVVWQIAEKVEDIPKGAYCCSSLIINMPPQHFKSRTLTHYVCWSLGRNNQEHFISVSYNQDLADTFSRYARDEIQQIKRDPNENVFSDVFPTTVLKQDARSAEFWAVEGSHFSYASSGMGGSITGRGATIKIVDDPIKNNEEALNETALEQQYQWFKSTLASRKDASVKESLTILNMTRWSNNDMTGKILNSPDGKYWYRLVFSAYDEEKDEMLCEDVLSKGAYMRMRDNITNDIDRMIFLANYQQNTINLQGALIPDLKTYTEIDLPHDERNNLKDYVIKCKVDVADKGTDALVAGAYMKFFGNPNCYFIDVLHTTKPQDYTEDMMVDFIIKNKINEIQFESNNGGGRFADHVEEKCIQRGWRRTTFRQRWTSANKETKILTNSPVVLNIMYMPTDWKRNWREFAEGVLGYQKVGKNKHDDDIDMLTMCAEDEDTSYASSGIVECRF